jgi:hypothetical protein
MALACPTCGAPVSEGARFCASCGAQLGELTDRGEQRKVVSILFADVTGSTSLGERVHCINVQMGPSQGAVILAHRGQTERALELTRMPFPFEAIVGPIEGAQASALVAAGAVTEGLALAEEVLANAPRWRALEAAAAALEAVTFGDEAEAIDRQLINLSDVRAVGPHMAAVYDRADGRAKA